MCAKDLLSISISLIVVCCGYLSHSTLHSFDTDLFSAFGIFVLVVFYLGLRLFSISVSFDADLFSVLLNDLFLFSKTVNFPF